MKIDPWGDAGTPRLFYLSPQPLFIIDKVGGDRPPARGSAGARRPGHVYGHAGPRGKNRTRCTFLIFYGGFITPRVRVARAT